MSESGGLSTSFGRAAAMYEQGRPDYPAAAVEWLLDGAGREGRAPRVADVGAGTGKLTRALVTAGAEAVAIDPDPAMLATLRAQVPGVPTFEGTAEALPLPTRALDAVVLGQAWHWVDPVAACAEIGRVLRPGGVLGLIWNTRDDRTEWVARLAAIMKGSKAEALLAEGAPPIAPPFAAVAEESWEWARPVSRETLTAMVFSRSYLITASEAVREAVREEVGALFDEIGARGSALVDLPYVTRAYRSVLP